MKISLLFVVTAHSLWPYVRVRTSNKQQLHFHTQLSLHHTRPLQCPIHFPFILFILVSVLQILELFCLGHQPGDGTGNFSV